MAEEADLALVAVSQRDREAAAQFVRAWDALYGDGQNDFGLSLVDSVWLRSGDHDDELVVQHFARHRLAAERRAQSEGLNDRAQRFIAEIHARTPQGEWIEVQHHPDGDWSVANGPVASEGAQGEAAAVLAGHLVDLLLERRKGGFVWQPLMPDEPIGKAIDDLAAALGARSTTASADMVLVPREPTEAMLSSGGLAILDGAGDSDVLAVVTQEARQCWSAMIAAAPSQISAGDN